MEATTTYFAFNQASAWADPFLWAPLQIAGSIGMLLGETLGIPPRPDGIGSVLVHRRLFFIWDRDLGFRRDTLSYWVITWGMWPVFGIVEGVYCFVRLVE